MAYTVEHIKTLAGLDKVLVTADTVNDMPVPEKSWAAGSTCEVLENGGSKYRLSNAGEWVEVDFETGGGGVSEEYVQQKIAEAQLSGGDVDLSAYPLRSEVETMIADNQVETDNQIAAVWDVQLETENRISTLENDAGTLRLDCDNNTQILEQVQQEQTRLADDMEEIKLKTTVTAFPAQDASVEGIWLRYAEYSFPLQSTYESTDVIFLVRNRVVTEAPALGILAARLRYDRANAAFQFASLRWLQGLVNIDINAFALCYDPAEARAALYVRCDTIYSGFVFTALAMGTSNAPLDMTAWALEDATVGESELPTSGWTTIISQA